MINNISLGFKNIALKLSLRAITWERLLYINLSIFQFF